jgi:hypothetical protein
MTKQMSLPSVRPRQSSPPALSSSVRLRRQQQCLRFVRGTVRGPLQPFSPFRHRRCSRFSVIVSSGAIFALGFWPSVRPRRVQMVPSVRRGTALRACPCGLSPPSPSSPSPVPPFLAPCPFALACSLLLAVPGALLPALFSRIPSQ